MKLHNVVAALAVLAVSSPAFAHEEMKDPKAGLTPTQMEARMMRAYTEIWNMGNMKTLDEIVAPGIIDHAAPPGTPQGREGVKKFFQMTRAAFPDLKFTPVVIIAEGDNILTHFWVEGTQKGPFMGMPATGKHFKVDGFDRVRVVNGQAVEHWGGWDRAAMMMQLGHMPMPKGHDGAKPHGDHKHGDHSHDDHKHGDHH